jgi:hypothetical protein
MVALAVCQKGGSPYAKAAVSLLQVCCTDAVVLTTVQDWVKDEARILDPQLQKPGGESQRTDNQDVCEDLDSEAGLQDAEAEVARDQANGEVSFYFVDADYIRTAAFKAVPSWQELKDQPHVLIKRTFSVRDAYRRSYVVEYGSVSHRWEMSEEPDPDGVH